jgi:hypothetical protein
MLAALAPHPTGGDDASNGRCLSRERRKTWPLLILLARHAGSPNRRAARRPTLATDVVLKNIAVFGSVNANRRHYYRAAKVLAEADPPSAGDAVPLRKSGPRRPSPFP